MHLISNPLYRNRLESPPSKRISQLNKSVVHITIRSTTFGLCEFCELQQFDEKLLFNAKQRAAVSQGSRTARFHKIPIVSEKTELCCDPSSTDDIIGATLTSSLA
jgi:hypothetical protein